MLRDTDPNPNLVPSIFVSHFSSHSRAHTSRLPFTSSRMQAFVEDIGSRDVGIDRRVAR